MLLLHLVITDSQDTAEGVTRSKNAMKGSPRALFKQGQQMYKVTVLAL